jgi:hypothetical protein
VSAMMLFCNRISFAQVRIEQMYSDINMHCVGMACVFFVKYSIEYVFHCWLVYYVLSQMTPTKRKEMLLCVLRGIRGITNDMYKTNGDAHVCITRVGEWVSE